jgi:dihydroorotate dehydrogenase electron transfer subunit
MLPTTSRRGKNEGEKAMLAILKERRPITDRDHYYRFECPELAQSAQPGQFVEIKVCEGPDPYLRRPISIFSADDRHFAILVRTIGRGTTLMEKWEPGATVDLIGPLGHGFTWQPEDQNLLLVGGGIGIAPLHFLAERLADEKRQVTLLFSPRRDSQLLGSFLANRGVTMHFAENRADIPDVMEKLLAAPTDRLFACGPEGMMKLVTAVGLAHHLPVQVSMEANMACGIGICLGCAIPLRTAQGVAFKKVCHDGPVFAGEELIFND